MTSTEDLIIKSRHVVDLYNAYRAQYLDPTNEQLATDAETVRIDAIDVPDEEAQSIRSTAHRHVAQLRRAAEREEARRIAEDARWEKARLDAEAEYAISERIEREANR